MNIPDYERVIYQYNPLIEVVAQLRFPTILKIAHQQPVDFQDNIRFEYPLFEIPQNVHIPPEIASLIPQLSSPLTSNVTYLFKSEDSNWQLSLNKESLTFSTVNYKRYEQFITRLEKIVKVFEAIYKPSFYSRMGFRYRNLIIRSNLNIQDKEWSKLIPKHIASELYTPEIASSIKTLVKNLQLENDFGQVVFNHGIVNVKDTERGTDEPAYLLDADFFIEEKIEKSEDARNILDKFNHSARNLFRWSITEELHNAMCPQPIKADTD